MYIIEKRYENIPFAHRQHRHDGHCKLIHGHNWAVVVALEAEELDENGFVFDFGKMKYVKETLDMFDHAMVINEDDTPFRELVSMTELKFYMRKMIVPSGSAEGLAKYFYDEFVPFFERETAGRVRVAWVRVEEDGKNSATYYPQP